MVLEEDNAGVAVQARAGSNYLARSLHGAILDLARPSNVARLLILEWRGSWVALPRRQRLADLLGVAIEPRPASPEPLPGEVSLKEIDAGGQPGTVDRSPRRS